MGFTSSPTFAQTIRLNGVRFLGLSEVNPTPTIKKKKQTKSFKTRGSEANPAGRRIVADYGSNDSWGDVEFEIPYLTPSQDAALQSHFDGTGTLEFSPDDGDNTWVCRWAEDGYDPSNYENNGNIFRKAKIKLMVRYKV